MKREIIIAILFVVAFLIFIIVALIIAYMKKRSPTNKQRFTSEQYDYANRNRKELFAKDGYNKLKKKINVDPIDYHDLKKALS
jgi:hypothetical protein